MALLYEKTTVRLAPFGMDFVFSVYYLAAPLLLIDLMAGPVELGLVGTLAAVVHMLFAHVMGGISDRVGRRRLILAAPLIFSATCVLVTQLRDIRLILGLSVINGVCLAIYWPSLQAWIADGWTGKSLAEDIGSFNMSWTSATLTGPVISGVLYGIGPNFSFLFAACVSLFLFLLVRQTVFDRPAGSGRPQVPVQKNTTEFQRGFLHAAWVANFASWFIIGNARYQFPKLARELLVPPHLIGILFSFMGLALLLGFFLLQRTGQWHFRKGFLLGAQLSSPAGLMLMAVADRSALFALALFLIGISCSVTYYSSLYYSVVVLKGKGKGSGLHESILGTGAVLGPLMGGVAASYWGLRAPYLLCACMVAVSLFLQYSIFCRRRD